MNARILPVASWVVVIALLGALAVQFSAGQKREAEIARLRQGTGELEELRAEVKALRQVQVQSNELVRLRKDNEELHRLRAEIHQLHEERRAGTQARSAAPAVAGATVEALQAQLQQALAENQQLRSESQQVQQAQTQTQQNACINNLRLIDGAKQQWALENKKTADAPVAAEDIAPYLRNNAVPTCPSGGAYTLNIVGIKPTCSLGATLGHTF